MTAQIETFMRYCQQGVNNVTQREAVALDEDALAGRQRQVKHIGGEGFQKGEVLGGAEVLNFGHHQMVLQ